MDTRIPDIERSLFELAQPGMSLTEATDALETLLVGTETDADLGLEVSVGDGSTAKEAPKPAPVAPAPVLPASAKLVDIGKDGLDVVLLHSDRYVLLNRGTGEMRALPKLDAGLEWRLGVEGTGPDQRVFVATFDPKEEVTSNWLFVQDCLVRPIRACS